MSALVPMTLMALLAGVLVVVSRSVNGRLSLATSPMQSSFWNHAVGAAALIAAAGALGRLMPPAAYHAPWYSWAGGPVGVIFIALGSYLVPRIGAALTAMLVISGQMISGVAIDLICGAPLPVVAKVAGAAMILAGIWMAQRQRRR